MTFEASSVSGSILPKVTPGAMVTVLRNHASTESNQDYDKSYHRDSSNAHMVTEYRNHATQPLPKGVLTPFAFPEPES